MKDLALQKKLLDDFLKIRDKKLTMSLMLELMLRAIYMQGRRDGFKEALKKYGVRGVPKKSAE